MTRISLVLVPINLQRQRRDQILTLGAHCPSSFHFQHSLLCIINQYHARVLILYIKKRISRSISDFVFCFLVPFLCMEYLLVCNLDQRGAVGGVHTKNVYSIMLNMRCSALKISFLIDLYCLLMKEWNIHVTHVSLIASCLSTWTLYINWTLFERL